MKQQLSRVCERINDAVVAIGGMTFLLLALSLPPTIGQPRRPILPHRPAHQNFSLPPTDAPFFFVSYLGKCLDVGSALNDEHVQVIVASCTQVSSQRITIHEVGPDREVLLQAAGKCLGPMVNSLIQQMPLALRTCDNSDLQKFVFDGDSIIAATNRDLVVEVRNGPGTARTQLWLNHRDLDDPEFWSVVPVGITAAPTSGFVRVPEDEPELGVALANATAGTVIQLNTNVVASANQHFEVKQGVTIRGGRRGIDFGPEVSATTEDNSGLFILNGEFTRITGLRIRGPSRATGGVSQSVGVFANDGFHTIVDHNDISDWPHAAVEVRGARDNDCSEIQVRNDDSTTYITESWSSCCNRNRDSRTPTARVRVVSNFIHHNRLQGRGYGVVSYSGAYPSIEHNTFTQNRHAIAADGKPFTGYQAVLNLVLSEVPLQSWNGVVHWHTQDFDIHGRDKHSTPDHTGSAAGYHTEIIGNTFLGISNTSSLPISDHPNFHLRGTPCDVAIFSRNVSLESRGDAISYNGEQQNLKLNVENNFFNHRGPTSQLRVGDFDGDGYDDLFIATGAAWYYSPRGKAEWRFLRADTTTADMLLFGDFDGDGRTDVFTQRGSDWLVSWGGISNWEKIASHSEPMSEYRVGDFDGDGRSDIFFASGTEWLVASAGTAPFLRLAASSERSSEVRLGDFNGDRKTDVLVPNSAGGWTIFESGTGRVLRIHRNDPTKHIVSIVADLDGDGRADVVSVQSAHGPHMQALHWFFVSAAGTGPWISLGTRKYAPNAEPAIGRFRDQRRVDMLEWRDTRLFIFSAIAGPEPGFWSTQDMS